MMVGRAQRLVARHSVRTFEHHFGYYPLVKVAWARDFSVTACPLGSVGCGDSSLNKLDFAGLLPYALVRGIGASITQGGVAAFIQEQ